MNAARILVVDDDQKLVQLLSLWLQKAGFEVIAASDAYQGLRLAIEQRPDLMLLDIHMPAGEGFSVQERFQKSGLHVPVIYISGDSSSHVEMDAKKLGAFAVIRKPLEIDQLLALVKAGLKHSDHGCSLATT